MKSIRAIQLASVVVLALCLRSEAKVTIRNAVINVDFQPSGAGGTYAAAFAGQAGFPDLGSFVWNKITPSTDGAYNGDAGSGGDFDFDGASFTSGPLVDSSGAPNSATVTVNKGDSKVGAAFAVNPAYGTYANCANDAKGLMSEYLIAANNGLNSVVINNLTPGAHYNLYLYGAGDQEIRNTTFAINSISKTTAGVHGGAHNLTAGQDYVIFNNIVAARGSITVQYKTGGKSPEGPFNGFQLIELREGADTGDSKAVGEGSPTELYKEPYRPQFHFTPERNWMNDPNGMVYFDGEYHLFYQYNPFGDKWGHMSWGHAVSEDLIHWKHLPLALAESDGVMIFSGSAVVDWNNTSGFGKDGQPPLVAIYTGNYTEKPLQNENIAYSNDRGHTWTKFSGNPVLDIGEKDFRDPKVFWHEPTKRWIMVVSLAVQKKVCFYASSNLKQWTQLSDFGPAGSTKGVWECPDLFPLAVDGKPEQTKWVLIVNTGSGAPAGGSGCQYFVGDFDGKQFVLDPSYPTQQTGSSSALKGKVLADFEKNDWGNWKATGSAFGNGPSHAGGDITGVLGHGYADSFGKGDSDQAMLTSPEFEVDADTLSFLIGGGSHPGELGIRLIVGGQTVRTATGNNSPNLEWKSWDVSEFRRKPAHLEIFDSYSGSDWGHILVDDIVLGGNPPSEARAETALWLDFGKDFYAGVTWSGIPERDGRRLVLGWMSNWLYGEKVPTSPWRSAMTVPRVLTLRQTAEGPRLFQQPVVELQKLWLGDPLTFSGSFRDAAAWLAEQKDLPPLLDATLIFTGVSARTSFAVNLRTGTDGQTSVLCDPKRDAIIVDRTRSGITEFDPAFPGRHNAPLRLTGDTCTLRLLLDTSSLEVFAQDGATVLTDLIFPSTGSRRLSLTADEGESPATVRITLHTLSSSWSSR